MNDEHVITIALGKFYIQDSVVESCVRCNDGDKIAYKPRKQEDDDKERPALCIDHLREEYSQVIYDYTDDFVMIWQRAANSGIIEFEHSLLSRVIKASWSQKHVRTTIVVGKIVCEYGVQG